MPVIDPIPPEKASEDLRETYDSLSKRAGRVPDSTGSWPITRPLSRTSSLCMRQ